MMKTVTLLVAAGLVTAAQGQTVWYNGDPDNENGATAEFNGEDVTDSYVFENFDHPGGTITDIWGNFYISTNMQGYMYEIRSGMSNGFGGTLHAFGNTDGAYTLAPNGSDNFGFTGYLMTADIADIDLAADTYMIALSIIGDGTGRALVQTTSGANGIGSPLNDDLNWIHSNYLGFYYAEGFFPFDVSYGVNIPAPASVALLGLGGLVAFRRRR